MFIHSKNCYLEWQKIHVFYPVRQQVLQQGSQRNKNVFQQNKKNNNIVEKPVSEQVETFLFS